MWEWSKTKTNNNLLLKNKLSENLPSSQNEKSNISSPISEPEKMLAFLQSEASKMGLKNIEFKKCSYHPQTWADMEKDFKEYQRIRKSFLKLIGYSKTAECKKIGFDSEDIELLKNKKTPENYNTHLKIPTDFGGKINFDNLSLIKSHPCHDQIHKLIDIQLGSGFLQTYKIIYIPWFEGNIYYE